MNTITRLSLVVAAVCAGLYAWSITHPASADAVSRAASTDVATATTGAETQGGRASMASRATSEPGERHEATAEDIEARRADALRARETAFMAEPVSPDWAARTEKQILDALSAKSLAAAGASTPLAEVAAECRSFSCRVEATYADQDEFEVAQQVMIGNIASQMPASTTFVDRRPDGTIRGTIYATSRAPAPKHPRD